MNTLEQDLKTLRDLNTRLRIAVWVQHAAVSVPAQFMPVEKVDKLLDATGFRIVLREEETTPKTKEPMHNLVIPDVS
jgi:hypothetical protein